MCFFWTIFTHSKVPLLKLSTCKNTKLVTVSLLQCAFLSFFSEYNFMKIQIKNIVI